MERLQQAKVACGAVNGVDDLIVHPQLRTVEVPLASSTNVATVVAPPVWLFGAPTSGTQMVCPFHDTVATSVVT